MVVLRAIHALEEYDMATKRETEMPRLPGEPRQLRWTAPSVGWLKVNWDASLNKNKGWMGYGVVTRDDKGRLVATLGKTVVGFLDLTMAEARTLLLAIKFCKAMGSGTLTLKEMC